MAGGRKKIGKAESVSIFAKVPAELIDVLDREAAERFTTRSEVLRSIILDHVRKYESASPVA